MKRPGNCQIYLEQIRYLELQRFCNPDSWDRGQKANMDRLVRKEGRYGATKPDRKKEGVQWEARTRANI